MRRRMSRPPKTRTVLHHHAKGRALERYDLDLNRHDLAAIIQLIQAQQGRFVERQSFRVSVWDVTYQGKVLRVVYDRKRTAIVTFLSADCIEADPAPPAPSDHESLIASPT